MGVISDGFKYNNIQDNGFEIKTNSGECIPEFTKVIFGIKTDKPAQCKIDTNPLKDYKGMEGGYFGASNLYLINHTTGFAIPSPEALKNEYNLTEAQVAKLGEFNLYVKCRSFNGAENAASYSIKSCIKPGPDLTPPYVTKASPPSGSYLAYKQDKMDISVYVNEPADCKWSTSDIDYEQMENPMGCQKDLEDSTFFGWPCNVTLSGADKVDKFYIRCQDISDKKNPMTQSYPYEFVKSTSQLVIDEFRPAGGYEIITDIEPVSFEMELQTSGGAENGKAVCKWSGNGYSDTFQETDSNYHKYKITSASRGNYNINFFCEDAGRNTAVANTSFKILVDKEGPIITRMYYEGGLKIMTNEDSSCRYSFNKNLVWENATEFGGSGKDHSAEWTQNIYYVQCKDGFGNLGGKVIIKPVDLTVKKGA